MVRKVGFRIFGREKVLKGPAVRIDLIVGLVMKSRQIIAHFVVRLLISRRGRVLGTLIFYFDEQMTQCGNESFKM